MRRFTLALIALLAVPLSSGRAAVIDLVKGDDGKATITVTGDINRGDDERFSTVAGVAPEQTTVLLDSLGGNLSTGLRIGSAIRMRAWKTAVPDGAFCASACGLIWLGGVQRAVGQLAHVGFHAAWIEGPDGLKRETGAGNALVGSYLNRLGLTDTAVLYLTSAPPDGAAWLSEVTAREIGVRADFGVQVAALNRTPSSPPISAILTSASSKPDQGPDKQAVEQTALLGVLYADFPRSVHTPDGTTCVARACKIRLAAADSWKSLDGMEHRIIVGVAEVEGDCHVCAAILGVGTFKRLAAIDTWEKETLTPAVTRVGAYGSYGGKIAFVDGGPMGRVITIDDGYGGQGEFSGAQSYVMVINGSFKEVLIVPSSMSVDGSCDDKEAECRQRISSSDYDSTLMVAVQGDGKLHIDQTFKAAIAIPAASWIIDRSGIPEQTAGGKANPGASAQDRATPKNVAFTQGRADRLAYEAWFSALPPDMHAGAESWSGRRSLRAPGNCDAPTGKPAEWTLGCTAARIKLTNLDARRKLEPDYKRGWNSL